ncbi:MAG: PEP-CTERM sorting domain-containing protein [Verrucomicrobiae bacterium]|nr:PEP-CTERM sorting domain-containing protein [Verrucomicrobiae bacterium]
MSLVLKATPVPEPAEWAAITGLGLAGFAALRRRSRG